MADAAVVDLLGDGPPRGADLRGVDLRRARLAGSRLRFADLSHARLAGADLTGARWSNVVLTSADLTGADLADAELTFVDATEADLSGCRAPDSRWRHADLRLASFAHAGLRGARFTGCTLEHTSFADADLDGGAVADSTCTAASFRAANLAGVETVGSTFDGADLVDARRSWSSHEIVAEILWRHVDRDDPQAVQLVGAVRLNRHWCYREWREYLATPDMQAYYALAVEILAVHGPSGAAEALQEGRDWRAAR